METPISLAARLTMRATGQQQHAMIQFGATGGCDLSCTPIDSGVLFLLLGGAAFGGMMIMRRRQEALEVFNSNWKVLAPFSHQ